MSKKKILIYVFLSLSVVLLVKIYSDRLQPGEVPKPVGPPEEEVFTISQFPVSYSLGTIDPRFAIDRERVQQIVKEAEQIWEDAAGRELFEYRPDALLKVNLIFDWRQERLLEAQERKAQIDESGGSFNLLKSEYEEKARAVDRYRVAYEEASAAYKTNLAEYNARVAVWNEGKNHTESEYQYLTARKDELVTEQEAVEKKRIELNTSGDELNSLGNHITALAKKYNLEIENFNGTLVELREFEKGLFNGKAVNIYEFQKEDDLKITIVHELGHVLGLGHLESPSAIMHHKLAAQDLMNIRLTSDDLNALSAKLK